MEEINVVLDASEELRALNNACATLSDQTIDHLTVICGMLTSYITEDNISGGNNVYNSIINHIMKSGDEIPTGLLEICMSLYSKLYLSCISNPYIPNPVSVSLVHARPQFVAKVHYRPDNSGGG